MHHPLQNQHIPVDTGQELKEQIRVASLISHGCSSCKAMHSFSNQHVQQPLLVDQGQNVSGEAI
jgi:hypothetical protein